MVTIVRVSRFVDRRSTRIPARTRKSQKEQKWAGLKRMAGCAESEKEEEEIGGVRGEERGREGGWSVRRSGSGGVGGSGSGGGGGGGGGISFDERCDEVSGRGK
uniref:Uncharacterized protein n=1 Tax=Vespula pensylvanica TaxID=30213 RepID=A0A834UD38_VESPE|nr:hypothetical protein H0235_005034 [Vespula pensylvanica]